jgi:hypothetical protein
MALRSVAAMVFGAAGAAFLASPASAGFIEAGASTVGGHGSGCVFGTQLLPTVNQNVFGMITLGGTQTYQNCFPQSPNSGIQINDAASGSVSASFSATANSNGAVYSGSASGVANFATQSVGAKASGNTQIIGNFSGDDAAAYGLINETISSSSGTGQGTVKFIYSLDGTASVTNSVAAATQSALRGGFARTNLYSALTPVGVPFVGNSNPYFASVSPEGTSVGLILPAAASTETFTTSGVTVTTTATVETAAFNFTFGQQLDYSFALATDALPQNETTGNTDTVDNEFSQTATLTGIQLFDANGQAITNFVFDTDAGVELGPNGVITTSSAVPEPSALLLLASGLGVLGLCGRRRDGKMRLAGLHQPACKT